MFWGGDLLKNCEFDDGFGCDTPTQVPGWNEYEARRQGKHTKQINSNVMLPSHGFDDGLDHCMQN
eukprot:278620-Pyramimonas_sp.AAC.1